MACIQNVVAGTGRLIITLVGIVFSTVLTLIEVGIYLGMMGNATSVVRHTDADIWVVSQNVPNFDFTQPFPAYRINRIRALWLRCIKLLAAADAPHKKGESHGMAILIAA